MLPLGPAQLQQIQLYFWTTVVRSSFKFQQREDLPQFWWTLQMPFSERLEESYVFQQVTGLKPEIQSYTLDLTMPVCTRCDLTLPRLLFLCRPPVTTYSPPTQPVYPLTHTPAIDLSTPPLVHRLMNNDNTRSVLTHVRQEQRKCQSSLCMS
jgi:hypothetical protein